MASCCMNVMTSKGNILFGALIPLLTIKVPCANYLDQKYMIK